MIFMYEKGQAGIIAVVFAIIFIVFVILVFLGIRLIPTGNIPEDTDNSPNLVVTNSKDCLNQRDPFGPFNYANCGLNIKNLEQKSVELAPEVKCWELSNPSGFKIIKAEKDAIPAGSTKTFSFSYNNGGREWSCQIHAFNAKF